MDKETPQKETTLRDQRHRRARINRIKIGIILFVLFVMLASIVMNIVLAVKSNSLQKQINTIVEYLNDTAQTYTEQEMVSEAEQRSRLTLERTVDEDYVFPVVDNNQNAYEEGDERTVYLTFDDGPSSNTSRILEILDTYGVKATFFCVGKEDEASLAAYKQIADAGHSLGMHSYSHSYSAIYSSLDSFREDFMKIHELLLEKAGVDCRIYRFPGGSSNQVSDTDMNVFLDYLGENSVAYFDWNVSSGDGTSRAYTTDEIIENVTDNVVKYKQSVVLLHDSDAKDTTVEALPGLIEELLAMDCTILPIIDSTPAIHHSTISIGG